MEINTNPCEIEKKFQDFLIEHDHPLYNQVDHDDSKFHHLKCPNGCATDARYKLYSSGFGYLKCWKCDVYAKFNPYQPGQKQTTQFSKPHKIGQQKPPEDIRKRYSECATAAEHIFSIANNQLANNHNYLRLKQVQNYGLRVLTLETDTTKTAKCYPGTLLVPCRTIDGKLVNLERIYFSRKENKFQKRPLEGAQRNNTFYLIGHISETTPLIYIAEGYGTAATIFEAFNCPTITAFCSSNLPYVAQTIRARHPKIKIIILGDIDDDSKGEIYAKKSAALAHGTYALPNFSEIPTQLKLTVKRSDFNDLFVLLMANGLNRTAALATVRQQIQQQ